MKKIIGVVATTSLFLAVLHTAFAVDSTTGIDPNYVASTTTTTSTTSSGTTDTTIPTTDTTTTTTGATNTSTILQSYLTLEGADTVITGTEKVYIGVNRDARYLQSVKVGIRPEGSSIGTTLGQAVFDSVGNRWIFVWNSVAHTPNGVYILSALVTIVDGAAARSNEIKVTVKNEATIVNTATAPAQTTQVTTSVTNTVSTETTTSTAPTPLTAYTVLDGSGTVVSGTRNIFIKTSREIYSAEVVLLRNGVSEHLGQAHFDSVNRRWVYVWDSKMRTQDGLYRLFAIVKSADGLTARSNPLDVSVRNEKVVAPQASETIAKAPTAAPSDAEEYRREYLKKIEEETQRRIEEQITKLSVTVEQSAVQKAATQPAPEQQVLPNTERRGTPLRPSKLTTPVDYQKVINEKSLELKEAVEKGDANKRAAIVAEIVRVARGSDETTPPGSVDPLAQKVEEGVRKLEQVIIEQEHGVVDEKIFKVERVEVAEVATKQDGTQTASKVAFRGKALPDSFVTLYIFSLPIVVTVKTDADGNWNYTLDKELEDGNHQVYVGITDVKGKVVVKSNPLPFVKTASAITVEEALAVPQAQAAPSFVENNYFYGIVTIIIMFVAYIFIFLGIKMSKTSE